MHESNTRRLNAKGGGVTDVKYKNINKQQLTRLSRLDQITGSRNQEQDRRIRTEGNRNKEDMYN